MPQRTTVGAVQGLLDKDYDAARNPSLQPHIDWATEVTDDVASYAAAADKALTSTRLEKIERWLAAHSYCMTDRTYSARRTLSARGDFDGKTGMYLEATMYGQQAKLLDSSGSLAAIASSEDGTVDCFWLGLPPSEQTPYRDRD